ncbi:hypothetical protein WMY93_026529 [Mugilogobius chulae]|uniref:Uncharacterized protein n=1 Tax=Mugilogobius chulae TaxID=88201 RepID=A0AAW0N8V3_9GOBI
MNPCVPDGEKALLKRHQRPVCQSLFLKETSAPVCQSLFLKRDQRPGQSLFLKRDQHPVCQSLFLKRDQRPGLPVPLLKKRPAPGLPVPLLKKHQRPGLPVPLLKKRPAPRKTWSWFGLVTELTTLVCRCKAGFTCANEACDSCVELPATTAPPTTTTTTTTTAHITENQLRWFRRLLRKPQNLTGESVSEGGSPTLLFPPRFVFNREVRHTPPAPAKPIQDTAWFLIIISLLVLGIALVIVTKIKPLLSWFSQNKNYCLVVKPLSEPVTVVHVQEEKEEQQEEEDSVMVLDEACTPVQEMCGQCDLLKTETNHDSKTLKHYIRSHLGKAVTLREESVRSCYAAVFFSIVHRCIYTCI